VRTKIHELIDRLDDDILQPALHAAVDSLPDEAVPRVLRRMLRKQKATANLGAAPTPGVTYQPETRQNPPA
jgi:hypothetical protein